MSRKGNCWDNAVAESFFSSLKKERIKKQIYKNRELAANRPFIRDGDRVSTNSWELHETHWIRTAAVLMVSVEASVVIET